ncbi:MAG: UV DNA damage repair endonuclease UvsE [Clostridia bacterium]|nr:UV DNA damage repair endonuclease UvsE [Clostridia bacterium]
MGYACLALNVPGTGFRSCMQKNATDERLLEITAHNLGALEKLIDYNIENNIRLFRISSDIVPFGSSPVNSLEWWNIFGDRLFKTGLKIKDSGMRVSMHPGQYTVLNSPSQDVVERAARDLEYHDRFLTALGAGKSSKIILHLGGIYGDKKEAVKRFSGNYKKLSENIRQRLVLENDDRSYSICDILAAAGPLGIPAVYDNLHNRINSCGDETDAVWIRECSKTWDADDGRQKIHYSQQDPQKQPGAHTATISIVEFLDFYNRLPEDVPDIMLEVKDKNISAIKCINATYEGGNPHLLQKDWARCKYLIMEKSPNDYNRIRELFNENGYPVVEFYQIVEKALELETKPGNAVNAAQHVWGYFKRQAEPREAARFFRLIEGFASGTVSLRTIKNHLQAMAVKYNTEYLLDSYYFDQ